MKDLIFIFLIIIVVVIVALIAGICTKCSSMASRQEEYLEECARQRHIQKREDETAERTKSENQ